MYHKNRQESRRCGTTVGVFIRIFFLFFKNLFILTNIRRQIKELETKIKNLHLEPNQEAIGAVAIHNKCDISLNKAADLLHVSHEEALNEKNNLKKIEKPTTKKAKKFLELINK